jgi:hypothetical protein
LFQGVVLEQNPAGDQYNPGGFGVSNCDFDTIYAQGIVYNVGLNATAQNTFGDVGNYFGGITQPHTSIVDFASSNNISVGDMFERADDYAVTYPRVDLNGAASIAFTNGQQLAMGTYVRESGLTVTLYDDITSPTVAFSYSESGIFTVNIDYTITRVNAYRTGRITVVLYNGAGAMTYTDDYSENTNTGITLTVTQTGNELFVKYISTDTGQSGTMTYSISHVA